MRLSASWLRVLGTTLFAIALALVFFLIILSDGRVLNLRVGAAYGPTMLIVTLLCWAVLLAFGVRLTVGGWKHQRDVKRITLMVLLAVPPLWAIFSFLPDATPNWAEATLVGLTALAANFIAERVVPHRVTGLASPFHP